MFDNLLKSKFYTKCKSAIKLTKTRLEIIKRKRNAMQKYLRKDIEDLIKNGLDINAYGRAEGLLVEMNLTDCYNLVEEFCGCILSHLSLMNKQNECPEECKQAVSSLMFAAARFADLPELRDLRTIFSNRYGKSLEPHTNKEFVQKLKALPPSKDMKLQLLQEIALGAGLDWDSKALEQKLFNPPANEEARAENTDDNDQNKFKKWRNESIRGGGGGEEKENEQHNITNNDGFPSYGRREGTYERQRLRDNSERNVTEIKIEEEKGQELEKPFYNRLVPPPYTKQKPSEPEFPPSGSTTDTSSYQSNDSAPEVKPTPRSVRRRRSRLPQAANEAAKDVVKEEEQKETMVDKLLAYYSSKKSPYEVGNGKEEEDIGGSSRGRTRDGRGGLRTESPPARSPSPTPSGHVRARSLHTDDHHVHPKLPDYDDFVQRLASLKGK